MRYEWDFFTVIPSVPRVVAYLLWQVWYVLKELATTDLKPLY